MSTISGFSDVFGFIALDKLFTAHITGNIVILIAFIIANQKGLISKAIAIPLFMLFAFLISMTIELHELKKRSLCLWLIAEIILFSILLYCGIVFLPKLAVTSPWYIAISMLPICAMAIQNTLLRTYMPTLPPCTVMTGNLTQFIVDATKFFINRFSKNTVKSHDASHGIKRFGNALLGFVCGGLGCAIGFIYFGFWSEIAIIGLLLILLVLVVKSEKL